MAGGATLTQNTGESYGTFGYRTYVLITLTVVYTFNFIDRILISVVGGPIIEEFGLSNFEFGILSGIGFALFYTALGIPIASYSERSSRVRIIGVCVILWSIATVLCGFTVGFFTLLLARLAVGVGEAGCTPPANSLISDYYTPRARATALGTYAMGVTVGGLLAQLFGGSILQFFSWREAFIYIGAPGLLLGVIVLMTVKEPPRGYSDPPGAKKPEKASFRNALSELMQRPTFWYITFGATLASFAGYSLTSFHPLWFQYLFGYSAGETAIRFMALLGVAASISAFLGGFLVEKASVRSETAPCWVAGIALIVCGPIAAVGFLSNSLTFAMAAFLLGGLLQYFYVGAMYNVAQAVVSLTVRATAIAILLFVVNLIGYGLGPPFVGFVADAFTSSAINASAYAGQIDVGCSIRDPELSGELVEACKTAKGYGVRMACTIACVLFSVGGGLFMLGTRTYVADEAANKLPATA